MGMCECARCCSGNGGMGSQNTCVLVVVVVWMDGYLGRGNQEPNAVEWWVR